MACNATDDGEKDGRGSIEAGPPLAVSGSTELPADFQQWSVKQLRGFLLSQKVETRGIAEKTELIEACAKLPVARDLRLVRKALAVMMHEPSHDDGSLAPLFIRFAWHCCGTYDKTLGNGGSNGCTMRFESELNDPENKGLGKAFALLDEVHAQFPWLSRADLHVLAGTVAIEVAGGPGIEFATGRKDFTSDQAVATFGPRGCPFGDGKLNPNGSRLPAADLGPAPGAPRGCPVHAKEAPTIEAIRGIFDRLGFNGPRI